jgi:hypothetical protein
MSSEDAQAYTQKEIETIVANDWNSAKKFGENMLLSIHNISPEAIIGSILEEYHDRNETIYNSFWQSFADGVALEASEDDLRQAYSKLKSDPNLLSDLKGWKKGDNVASLDVGRGNI